MQRPVQVVFVGVGEDKYRKLLLKFAKKYPQQCAAMIRYDENLAHMVYAGADLFLMPSVYEPCGLAQMIAMRYGAVPVVRAVGGLVDTVFDRDFSDKLPEERNGYVFREADFAGLESALSRAIGLWYDYPKEFRRLITNGMASDYSWARSGEHYLGIYDYTRVK